MSTKNQITNKGLDPAKVDRVMKYRYVVFFTIAFAGMFTQFYRSSTGVIHNNLTEDYGLTATMFATFSVMYFYPYVAMQLPSGILADRWGVRNTISAGCLITGIGSVIFSTAPNFLMLCLGRALVGIGVATQVVCLEKLLSCWFRPREISTYSGIANAFGSLAGILAQAPLAIVLSIFSWRSTFLTLSILAIVLAVCCFLLIRNRPEDMGLPSIVEIEGVELKMETVREKVSVKDALLSVFTNKYVWPLLIIMPVQMGAFTLFSGTWGVPYFKEAFGFDNVKASTYTTYLMIGMLFCSFLVGFLSDKFKTRKKMMIAGTALTFIEWLAIYYGPQMLSNGAVMAFAMFMFGFTCTGVTMSFALVREYNDRRYTGIAIGATNTIGMLASAIFPSVCGNIIDKYSGTLSGIALYQKAFLFVLIASGLALVASLFIKETRCNYLDVQ